MTASTVLKPLTKTARSRLWMAPFAGLVLAGMAATTPARAGDDGYAPIWDSLGGIVTFGSTAPSDPIDYRERGKLVLPPKVELPPPAEPSQKVAAWPNDPDVMRVKKQRELLKTYVTRSPSLDNAHQVGKPLRPDQLKSEGASLDDQNDSPRCRRDPAECHFIPASILEKLGIVKEQDTIVAGEEPSREWLTDPPPGYRKAFANTKATFDATKRIDQSDARTALLPKTDP